MSGVTARRLGAAVSPRAPGVSSMPRNCLTALLISSGVAVTNDGPSVPSKWISLIGASRASTNSFSTSSISPASSMSEVVCSVKMSISSLRSAKSDLGGDLLARLAQEVLLAGGADDVVVGVAVAGVVERVEPAERLVAGLDVDLLVVLGGGLV